MDWSLHPARIRALLTSDTRDMDAPTQDWVDTFDQMIDQHGTDALVALTHAQEQHDKDETFDPDGFEELFQRTYRQCWKTAAKFAEHVAEGETEMGDEEERKGRAWFLEKYGRYIDWQEFADSPEIVGTYTMIMLDPESSREVHVFYMEA